MFSTKKKGNGFSVYTEYCIEHESSLKVCRELSSKLEWQTFEQEALAEVRHTSSQRKLQFQDFLIKVSGIQHGANIQSQAILINCSNTPASSANMPISALAEGDW